MSGYALVACLNLHSCRRRFLIFYEFKIWRECLSGQRSWSFKLYYAQQQPLQESFLFLWNPLKCTKCLHISFQSCLAEQDPYQVPLGKTAVVKSALHYLSELSAQVLYIIFSLNRTMWCSWCDRLHEKWKVRNLGCLSIFLPRKRRGESLKQHKGKLLEHQVLLTGI